MSTYTHGPLIASITFLCGVAFSGLFQLPPLALSLVVLSAFVATICYGIKRRPFYALFAVACLFGLFGVLRYEYSGLPRISEAFSVYAGTKVTIEGVVVDEPDIRERSTHLTVRPRTINGVSKDATGRVLVFAPPYPEFQYGDRVVVRGVLKAGEEFVGDGGVTFNYPMYLATKNIGALVFYPTIEKVGEGEGYMITRVLLQLKNHFQEQLARVLPDPHHALLSGLLLGGKQSLGEEWLNKFTLAGIVHVVVLSGYNMTIVGMWLVTLFRFTGFYGSLVAGGLGIVLFMIMTGAGATVVRAGIMALLALLARATGKTYAMGRALTIAGVLMVALHPGILLYDPSFQLSFLASLGLVFLSPIVDARLEFLARFPVVREVVTSTLATQAMVLPLLLHQTGLLSLVALPVNLMVLPFIPLTMLFGFVAGLCALIIPPLATVFALPAYMLLGYIFSVAGVAVQIPFAAVSVHASSTFLVATYVLIGVACVHHARRSVHATPS